MGQRFAKRERFFQIGNAEEMRIVGERFGATNQSVAVSVRFHDREHLSRANSFAHNFGVVPQRAPIDLSPATKILCHLFGIVMCGSRK